MPETRVVSAERLGPYTRVALERTVAPGVAGQFHMLRVQRSDAFLARALSVVSIDAKTLTFLCQIGPGPLALLGTPGTAVAIEGPFGQGFDVAAAGDRPLLVGGGFGVALLAGVSRALPTAALVAGFRDADAALAATLVPAMPQSIVFEPERVVPDLNGVTSVFAAGPTAMMHAVAASARAASIPVQVALEAPMACGYGSCYGCVVTLDGELKRLCVEGPVVDGARL